MMVSLKFHLSTYVLDHKSIASANVFSSGRIPLFRPRNPTLVWLPEHGEAEHRR